MMLPIISVLIGISLMYYIRQKRAEKEMDEIVNSISPSNGSNENIGTRDLCLELLRQLNCEVRVEHDDIYFTYQNEKFMIEASNESAFITISGPSLGYGGFGESSRCREYEKGS